MAKRPTEKLAAALRANLKRRKQPPSSETAANRPKDPEMIRENPSTKPDRPLPGT
jgi:hypothetical protein